MSRLRAAVIGAGQIARRAHLPGYVRAGVPVVALCDLPGADLDALAGEFGVARLYHDWRQMLADGGFDVVSVCTPPALHAAMTVEAARRGYSVLVEKPMALTVAECDAMIEAADAAGVTLMVAHNQRYIAHHQQAKALLDSGRLSRVYLAHAVIGHSGPEHWSPAGRWYFQAEQAGPGALADLGSHKIDLLCWLLGQRVIEIAALGAAFEKAAVFDTVACLLRFDGSALATLHASWAFHPGWENSLVLRCERGTLIVPTDLREPVRLLEDGADGPRESAYPAATDNDSAGWLATMAAFVQAVAQGGPAPISGAEGRAVIANMEAAYTALVSGAPARLDNEIRSVE